MLACAGVLRMLVVWWAQACGEGHYTSAAGTATTDAVCSACGVCGAGEYVSKACVGGFGTTAGSDSVCTACSTCGATEYAASECAAGSAAAVGSDRVCEAYTVCTGAGRGAHWVKVAGLGS